MPKASELFKRGDFNVCVMKSDVSTGIRTVEISKIGWKRSYKFTVRNLFQPDELIGDDEEVVE